jgi:hypothetical protein
LSSMARSPHGSNRKSMKLARKRLQWWSEFETETSRESMNCTILCTFSSFRSSSILVLFTLSQSPQRLSITVIFLGPCAKKWHNYGLWFGSLDQLQFSSLLHWCVTRGIKKSNGLD